MYNLTDGTITQQRKTEHIIKFVVWFAVPFCGLFEDYKEAVKACEDSDFDAFIIIPTPIALGETMYESLAR